jgi:hypothetical protein
VSESGLCDFEHPDARMPTLHNTIISVFFIYLSNGRVFKIVVRLTNQAQAQPPSGTLKSKMTNKFHKINHNWQGQRLLPAAIC